MSATQQSQTSTPESAKNLKALSRNIVPETRTEPTAPDVMREKQLAKCIELSGIPPRFARLTMAGITLVNVSDVDIHGSYFFYGGAGSGKSYVMGALAGELVSETPPLEYDFDTVTCAVRWRNIVDLFANIRKTFNQEGSGSESTIMGRLIGCKYLFLDDLGAEKTSDFTMDRLYHIINSRYENMRHIVITSNLPLSEIGKRCHDRIASRLGEMCKVKEFPKRDLRLHKATT